MTYQEYSKFSKELSSLLELKHKKGLTTKEQKRLTFISNKIRPFA